MRSADCLLATFSLSVAKSIGSLREKHGAMDLNAWKSKRLQDQIARMIESHDNYALIVEGKPEDFYAPSPDDWGHFRAFLNRVSVEVCPVVFTDTITETARYINAFKLRLEDDTQGHFVRPVTAVKSSRNAHITIFFKPFPESEGRRQKHCMTTFQT